MPIDPTGFSGEIKVASRIVDYLSSGLYETPAACLKELINNSYDADAKIVNVYVKPDANRIIIEDDGIGLNQSEFETHFRRVAESHKRDADETTELGRPKIGKIGIGFIAANEICDVLEIHSTKQGSTDLLLVEIDFSKMRQDPEERRREDSDFAKADYKGSVGRAPRDDHYTRLFLKGVRKEARRIFSGSNREAGPETQLSLYGLQPESVKKILAGSDLSSWGQFDTYSETLLRVALNVPVRYQDGIVASRRWQEMLQPFVSSTEELDFTLFYDGAEVRKPIVFAAPASRSFVQTFNLEGQYVSAKGYFYAQSNVLKPQDLNGLLIRIRNSAVGEYDRSFLHYPTESGTLFQRWISCELWASDQLEDALNIDRRTLRQTHDAVVELRSMLHKELAAVIARTRRELHGQSSARKKVEAATKQAEALDRMTASPGPTGAKSANRIAQMASNDPGDSLGLAKRYTASQFYEIVAEIASEIISDEDVRERVLARLLERLLES